MADEVRLPLRVTSIERFQLLDDSPEFPNWIGAVLNLSGVVDGAAGQAALDLTLQRHPLIGSRLNARRPGGPGFWVPAVGDERPEFRVLAADLDLPDQELPPRPDAGRAASGLAVAFVDSVRGRSRVFFLIHHALVDGLGGLQFVREWMLVYHNLCSGRAAGEGLAVLDPAGLHRRNHLGLFSRDYLRHLWRQPVAVFGAWKFLFRSFVDLSLPRRGADRGSTCGDRFWPRLRSVELDAPVLAAVRRAAQSAGVSLNDWLVGSLFETLEEWRKVHAVEGGPAWLRIIVPISLRTSGDRAMPAANRSTLVQFDRRAADLLPRIRLLQGIHFESGVIRSWRLERILLIAIRAMSVHRGWLGRSAGDKRRATTLLTNLGKPLLRSGLKRDPSGRLQFGGLAVESIDLVAPNKPGMPVSFAVHQNGDRLRITVQFSPLAIGEEQVLALLGRFAERIGEGLD